ncbi:TFIIH basal transcription factor complex helicase XPD subunit, putative [Plasmodium gallinaceum]|uniref:DNA 5'-3' helicase n=1 Tax=Plasmodium gallinaceum TaxID=5849 RepID=A0A1J1GWF7_PLAGA|nr:TFIIH basal transcription factor complex helicase XPD subunit, putative [Plasmodium gallinaceum]CRG96891.1 TFIIH basal transcription factor complex helicase XPD subunit, putative [Plasmodium gallinaceum]
MVVFHLDDLEVFFPYDYIYPEQYAYMKYLKKTLDSEGHCVLEMPTGTGKTVAIFSLITSYQYYKNDDGKFIFCTRTVAEMEKSLIELKKVIQYRINIIKQRNNKKNTEEKLNEENMLNNFQKNEEMTYKNNTSEDSQNKECQLKKTLNYHTNEKFGKNSEMLAIGISARRCMCVNDKVLLKHEREKIDEECRKLTATFVREKKYINYKLDKIGNKNKDRISDFILKNKHHIDVEDYFDIYNSKSTLDEYDEIGLCGYFENFKKEFLFELIEPGVYTIEDLKVLCKNYKNTYNINVPICPYFCAKKIIEISKVIVLNYQYVIDPKVSKSLFLGRDMNHVNFHKNDIIVFDEAHNIDSVCLEALSVNIDRNILNKASLNIKKLLKKIENSKAINEEKLKEECNKILQKIKSQKLNNKKKKSDDENDGRNTIVDSSNANIKSDYEKNIFEEEDTLLPTNSEKKRNMVDFHKQDIIINNSPNNNKFLESNNKDFKRRRIENEVYFDDDMNLVFGDMNEEKICEEENIVANNESNYVLDEQEKKKDTSESLVEDLKELIRNDVKKNDNNTYDGDKTNENRNNLLIEEGDISDLHFNPLLAEDTIKNIIIPGNIRKSEHFLNLMRIVVVYLKKYINIYEITSEGPLSFLYKCEKDTKLDTSFFKYCFDRLKSLLNTLQIVNIDDYSSLNIVCNFCTLLGNYFKGFIIICEPYPEATGIYDPVIQFACLDSSIAMKSVINKYKSIILTSGTITPLELYPKLLNFKTVLTASFPMSFDRNCVCPLIVTKSSDLVPLSSQFSLRNDINVIKNYGILLVEMCKNIPDGIVAYFPSYIYMEQVISTWYELGVIANILEYKLIFIETKDIVSTTIALHNFKKACDFGKGAVFLSICRGKIAEGIDFDKHYGKCVILFGIPYQYTLSKILKSRLDFLKETYNIQENEFLTFDAMRQASQCVGRIIRNKKDYGIMIFSDIRYSRNDKKNKLPPWIIKCMDISNVNLTIGTAVNISKNFLLNMSQQYKETGQTKISQDLLKSQKKCWQTVKSILNMDDFI